MEPWKTIRAPEHLLEEFDQAEIWQPFHIQPQPEKAVIKKRAVNGQVTDSQ